MNIKDPWDWPVLLYMGLVILNLHPVHFWRSTPRKLKALVQVHEAVNTPAAKGKGKSNNNNKEAYINNLF